MHEPAQETATATNGHLEGTAAQPIDLVSAAAALETAGAAVDAITEPVKKKAKKVTLRLSNGAVYRKICTHSFEYWIKIKITP